MAKMRGIKPEAFTDDKVLQVEPLARWLFVGMWTQACDNGHVEDNPVQLKVRLLPMDNCDVSDLVRQLVEVGLLDQHDGFLKIPNLSTHQKIDKRYLVFCKWCEHDENSKFAKDDRRTRDRSKEQPAQRVPTGQPTGAQRVPVDEGEGEGEGEGEYISNPPEQPTLSLVHPETSADASDRFEEFWKAYPKRSKANPKKPAREKFERITKTVDPQILIDAAKAYAKSEEGNDPKFIAQTQTWLNQERWNDIYEEPSSEPSNPNDPRNWHATAPWMQ